MGQGVPKVLCVDVGRPFFGDTLLEEAARFPSISPFLVFPLGVWVPSLLLWVFLWFRWMGGGLRGLGFQKRVVERRERGRGWGVMFGS